MSGVRGSGFSFTDLIKSGLLNQYAQQTLYGPAAGQAPITKEDILKRSGKTATTAPAQTPAPAPAQAPASAPASPPAENTVGSVGTYGLNASVKPDKRPKGRISTLLTGLGSIAESLGD